MQQQFSRSLRPAFASLVLMLLLLIGFVGHTRADFECNMCTSNGVACVSETQYQSCSANNEPQGSITTCGTNEVCSTANTTYCVQRGSDALVSCLGCNACDANNVFACTDTRSFVLCSGSSTTPSASSAIGSTCAEGFVCNVYTPQICTSSATTLPTCNVPYVEPTTEAPTTLAPITDAPTYCRTLLQSGRFSANDINCKQYVRCFLNNGIWSGQLYTCAGSTYFNENTHLCGTEQPTRCITTTTTTTTTTVRTLRSVDISTDEVRILPRLSRSNINPHFYCDDVQKVGRFAADDQDCRQFVRCYDNGNVRGGQTYVCPRNKYFNAATKECEDKLPSGCARV